MTSFFYVKSSGQEPKYRFIKNQFTTENYREKIGYQKYSPFAAGLCNFAYPPAGYLYINEPTRGLLVTGSQLITSGVFLYGFWMGMGVNYEYEKAPGSKALMLSGFIATSAIYLWSVFDVVKIAKIKNLAWQEMHQAHVEFTPAINWAHAHNKQALTAGISLHITF
ncbi:MAG: hypothetical protein PF486_07225 [Prolixibacteraceae bacterium]|nr:hypothetical protein [Prolixibacteraceae bacterium]